MGGSPGSSVPRSVPCAAAETTLKVSGSPSGSEAASVTFGGMSESSSVTTIWS
jgi:hypothetical protein